MQNLAMISFSREKRFEHLDQNSKHYVVDILGTEANAISCKSGITIEEFQRILTCRNVATHLFRVADMDMDGMLTLAELMEFLITLSTPA